MRLSVTMRDAGHGQIVRQFKPFKLGAVRLGRDAGRLPALVMLPLVIRDGQTPGAGRGMSWGGLVAWTKRAMDGGNAD